MNDSKTREIDGIKTPMNDEALENRLRQESGLLEWQIRDVMYLISEDRQKLAKAYGGCVLCYGKGYATVNDRWAGHDTDTDIGSPGDYISGGTPIP